MAKDVLVFLAGRDIFKVVVAYPVHPHAIMLVVSKAANREAGLFVLGSYKL